MQPQPQPEPAQAKVNRNRSNSTSALLGDRHPERLASEHDLGAAKRNGNRMKASAHKRQAGPTTTWGPTLLWPPSASRTIGGPRSSTARQPPGLSLIALTLILAGGLSLLLAVRANQLASLRLSTSPSPASKPSPPPSPLSMGQSRELEHNIESQSQFQPQSRSERQHEPELKTIAAERASAGPDSIWADKIGHNFESQHASDGLLDLDRPTAAYGATGLKSTNMSRMRRLLVRQLTSLIMSHGPEAIAARVRDQMSSETSDTLSSISTVDDDDHDHDDRVDRHADNDRDQLKGRINNEQHSGNTYKGTNNSEMGAQVWAPKLKEPSQSLARSDGQYSAELEAPVQLGLDEILATSSSQNPDPNPNSNRNLDPNPNPNPSASLDAMPNPTGDSPELLPTCPPDYDEQLFVDGGSANNLDAEQQQQLLAGADSSGLLGVNNRSATDYLSSSSQRPSGSSVAQCVHPGTRMIEVITKIITPILFTIIIIVGLLGNIIVMMVILEDRQTERELTPTNLLILDLSLADLSFIIFCIPFTGWDYSVGHWVFGSLWCKFNQYLIVVCALSSIYTLVLMSIDRFMAIVYPIECISYRTSKNTMYAIYIKWILILLMASPTIAMHGLIDQPMDPHQHACRFLADQYDPVSFQITFFITSYLFPLILIFCLYLSLLNKLWFGTKPHGHRESLKMLESKKKVTWLVAGIVVVFAICWCPIQVMLILMRLKSHKITATYVAIQVFAHTLGYMNSCVNPIVYAFASETFTNSFKRSVFWRFFRRCLCLPAPEDHGRTGYNYHSARPSNATFHNTTSLNHHSVNMGSNNNASGTNKAYSVHQNNQDNSFTHHEIGSAKGNDTHTCPMKVSQMTNFCRSSHNGNFGTKQVALPLEPRDRGISPILAGSNSASVRVKNEQCIQDSTRNDNDQQQSTRPRKERALIPREATISREDIDPRIKFGPPTKQQLVARVIQSGNNLASQRCETACYQQEVLGP